MPGKLNIDRSAICEMIPHSGDMCLLESVLQWDEMEITCSSRSHLLLSNPLRNEYGLPMSALLEYGAQAMAIHGCLAASKEGSRMQEGYLAALRDATLAGGLLSDVSDTLIIKATRIFASEGNMIYHMSIQAGSREIANGRATVVGKLSQGEII